VNTQDSQRELLNPSQKNSLRISLLLVEKGLLEVEGLLSASEYHGILLQTADDLDNGAKGGIQQLIEEVRGLIKEMKDRFQLDLEVERKSRAIFGKAPLLWEIVTDTDAKRLRGYGETDPRLRAVLDPSIERLGKLLLRLHQLVAGAQSDRWVDGSRGGMEEQNDRSVSER